MKTKETRIYVGRWDMACSRALREEGMNWVYEATEEEVIEEIANERERYAKKHNGREDKRIDRYTPYEFQAEFNEDLDGSFNTKTYWIKFF